MTSASAAKRPQRAASSFHVVPLASDRQHDLVLLTLAEALREPARLAVGDDAALVDDQHPLAGRFDLGQDVAREDHRALTAEGFDQLSRLAGLPGVQPCGRLVEDERLGRVDDRLREADALTQSA